MARAGRRLAVLHGHLNSCAPASTEQNYVLGTAGNATAVLEAAPTSSLMTTAFPLLAMGAYQWYQSRQQTSKAEARELTQLETVAEDHGFDADRLRLLDTWAAGLIGSKKTPGVVVAVARRGQIVFHEAYGDKAYARDSIMSIGHMATPIIAATLLSLVDEGLVNVDDDVTNHLPYFSNFRVHRAGKRVASSETDPLNANITIWHLLTDTWGFPSVLPVRSKDRELRELDALSFGLCPLAGNDADFERLVQIPLLDQPGRQYRVSLGASVIGHLICKITKRPLREVVLERILRPLGMEDTDWYVPRDKQARLVSLAQAVPWLTNRLWGNSLTGEHAGHTSWLGWIARCSAQSVLDQPPAFVNVQAGMFSTAVDQLQFHAMLLHGGVAQSGERVLSQESARIITTNQLPAFVSVGLSDTTFNSHARDAGGSGGSVAPQFGVSAAGQSIGFGMHVVTRPSTSRLAGSKGTFSAWGYNGVECWSDPALDLTVFIGTHLFPFWALPNMRQEVAGGVYGSLVSTTAAKHFAGGSNDASDGGMGNMMNMMMMMSMFGGMGGVGGMGAAAAGAGGAGGAAGAEAGAT